MKYRIKEAGYIPWHGGDCPLPAERLVHVVFASGSHTEGKHSPVYAGSLDWRHKNQLHINSVEVDGVWRMQSAHGPRHANIVAYRIITRFYNSTDNKLLEYVQSRNGSFHAGSQARMLAPVADAYSGVGRY